MLPRFLCRLWNIRTAFLHYASTLLRCSCDTLVLLVRSIVGDTDSVQYATIWYIWELGGRTTSSFLQRSHVGDRVFLQQFCNIPEAVLCYTQTTSTVVLKFSCNISTPFLRYFHGWYISTPYIHILHFCHINSKPLLHHIQTSATSHTHTHTHTSVVSHIYKPLPHQIQTSGTLEICLLECKIAWLPPPDIFLFSSR